MTTVSTLDPRLQNLSYSSLLTLHSCPREFQLYRLNIISDSQEDEKSSITFAFGHLVGEGIQLYFQGLSKQEIIWRLFLNWKPDLFACDEKKKKSFFYGLAAIELFFNSYGPSLSSTYKLAYYKNKPACELGFRIHTEDGFKFRGHVDAVLIHKETGQALVLEIKTTGDREILPAKYKNSSQAIGYSIVLDHIFPGIQTYDVLYLVYKSGVKEFEPLTFHKSLLQRALWIQELLLDIETIKLYNSTGVFPMRGESCVRYYRECKYFSTCTLSTEYLTKQVDSVPEEEKGEEKEYDIEVSIIDLIKSQLTKS